jgi:pyruvate,orthophosphate dikinase
MLQTRSGKRTAKAALRIAVEMAAEGLITEEEAVGRVEPSSLDQLLHPTLDPDAERQVIAAVCRRRPARPPARWSSTPTRPSASAPPGEAVILVRDETSPRTSTACTPRGASSPPGAG